jgi:hypothetical protein
MEKSDMNGGHLGKAEKLTEQPNSINIRVGD